MSSYPVLLPLSAKAGATLDLTISWKEGGDVVDLSAPGWSALLQVRTDPSDEVLIELASADGEIVLGGDPYNVIAYFTEDHTETLGAGSFKYDLRLDDGAGTVLYLIEGSFKLKMPISRPA